MDTDGKAVEIVSSTLDGTVVLRDAAGTAVADIRAAARAARGGGSQRGGGQVIGVAGGALLIRCADQESAPTLVITVHAGPPGDPGPEWTVAARSAITLDSSRLVVDGDAGSDAGPVDVGPPGRYALRAAHRGRDAFRQSAAGVRTATVDATPETRSAAWEALRGIEAYAVDLWPDRTA